MPLTNIILFIAFTSPIYVLKAWWDIDKLRKELKEAQRHRLKWFYKYQALKNKEESCN